MENTKDCIKNTVYQIQENLEDIKGDSYRIASELYLPARPDGVDETLEQIQSNKTIEDLLKEINNDLLEIKEVLLETKNRIS